MYSIGVRSDGTCWCSLTYQDGTETWEEKNLEVAVQSMIKGAYWWNHSRINKEMIRISKIPDPSVSANSMLLSKDDAEMLNLLRTGHKKALDHDDFRLKANLLKEEVDLIYAIREGEASIVWRKE